MNKTDKAENPDNATFTMKLGNDLSFAGRNVEPVTDSRTVASKAQRKVLERLDRSHATPESERNFGTFRFHGRGMGRTLASLEKQGLITFERVDGHTGDYFFAYLKGVNL